MKKQNHHELEIMRITNGQLAQLTTLMAQSKLEKELFNIELEDAVCYIKYNKNYFDFKIHKTAQDQYDCVVKWIDNKQEQKYRWNWTSTKNTFAKWCSSITEEIQHTPESQLPKKSVKGFSPEVVRYSKRFVKIYNQSMLAEDLGLDEICGFGYRKAFECLMRDYLIKKHPKEDLEKIRTLPIAHCINSYVTSDEVKLLALRVLWLGNDYAHYIKRWKSKNVGDLKKLIDLTLHWISIKDDLDKVTKAMPSPIT